MVNVFLGSIQPFTNVQANPNDDVDFSTTRYLGITVDADDNPATADPEMVPRQMIIPAFFAKNSQKLAGHDWSHLLVSGNNPQTGFINGAKLGGGTVTNVQIQDGGITTADIGDAQITGAKLAPGAADSAISDESITSAKIKNGEVMTADIAGLVTGDAETVPGAVTSEKIKDGTITGADIAPESIPAGRLLQDYAFFWDERGNTQTGGTPVSGWNKRTLNQSSVRNGSTFASRTGDTITLEQGTYWIRASAPGHRVRRHAIALRDVTGNPATPVVVLKGTTEHCSDIYSGLGEVDQNRSFIDGVISVADTPRQFELWHWIQVPSPDGLGGFPDAVGPGWPLWASLSIIGLK